MSFPRAIAALTVLAAAAAPAVRAGLAIGNPWSVTVAKAGVPLNVSWYDDGQCPQYSFEEVAQFPVDIDLCVKKGYEIISLKKLSSWIRVNQQAYAIGGPIEASLGPESSQYFIRLLSTGLTDNSTQSPWATYSANFTLTGMTGTFPQGIDAGELKPGDNHTRVWDHECSCHKNKETGKEDNTPNPPAVQPSELPQHNNAVPSSVVPGTPTTIKVGTPATTQPAHAIVSGSANATNPQNAAAGNPLANSSVPSAIPSIVTMTNHGGVVVTVTALCGCEDDLQHTVPASQSLTTTVITNSDGTQTITVPCEQTQSLANAIANPSITAPPGSSGAVVPVNAAVPTPSSTTSLHTKEDGSVETVTVPCKSGATGTAALPAITTSLSTQPDGSVETVTVPCESSGAAAPVISDGTFLGGGGGGNEPQTSVYATTNASFTGMVTVTKPCEVCQHHSGAATGAPGANATSTGKTNGTNWGDQINHLLNGGDSPRMGSPVALLGTALLGVGAAFTLLA